MKVVHLLPSMRRAGAESATSLICKALANSGHEVHLVIVGAKYDYQDEMNGSGVETHLLGLIGGDLRYYNLWARARIHVGLRECLRLLRPEVVHVHLSEALIWAAPILRSLRVKTFYTQHGLDSSFRDCGLAAWIRRKRFKLAIRISKCRLFAVSEGVKCHLERCLGIEQGSIDIVPNPVDRSRFRTRTATTNHAPSRIMMLGTLYGLKRVHVGIIAFECLHEYPTVILTIVGDGPDRNSLELRAASSPEGRRIEFLGVRTDTPRLFNATDVFWLLSEREGMPMVALEAMACGVPVVATDVLGTNELIEDGTNGLLVPVDNARAVAEATRRLWGDPALRRRLIEGGAHTASRYDIAAVLPALEAYYESS